MVYLRAFIVWLIIVLAEFIHGIARGMLLEPLVGDFRARQIAVFTGSAIILAISILFVGWIHAENVYQLAGIGCMWLVLMICFEIALGRFIFGYSWERIWQDYDLFKGGLLSIGMLVLMLAPLIAAKLRRLI